VTSIETGRAFDFAFFYRTKKGEEVFDFLPSIARITTEAEENPTSRTGPLDLRRRQLLPS
jgi:hypothetical protein